MFIMTSKGEVANAENLQQECVIQKVAELPFVSSTCEMVTAKYMSAKEAHPAIQAVCGIAESGMKTIAITAASTAQPLLNKFEPQIAAANTYACQGLHKLQETLPVVQQTVEKIVLDAKGLVIGAKDSVCTRVTGAKDTVSSVVNVAKESAQGSMETAISAVKGSMNEMLESSTGQSMLGKIDRALMRTEEWVDYYLPVTYEELIALVNAVDSEDLDAPQVELKSVGRNYSERLGALAALIVHRAYMLSLAKMKAIKTNTQDALDQLELTIQEIKHAKTKVNLKVQASQEKLQQIWLNWDQNQMERCRTRKETQEVEEQALNLSFSVVEHLRGVCQKLLADVCGLPVDLQEKLQQAQSNMGELKTALNRTRYFKVLPTDALKQCQEKIGKAQNAINEVLECVINNPSQPCVARLICSTEACAAEAAKQEGEGKRDPSEVIILQY